MLDSDKAEGECARVGSRGVGFRALSSRPRWRILKGNEAVQKIGAVLVTMKVVVAYAAATQETGNGE